MLSGDFNAVCARDIPRVCPCCNKGKLQLQEQLMWDSRGWNWRVAVDHADWVYRCDSCATQGTHAQIDRKAPTVTNQIKDDLLAGRMVLCGCWVPAEDGSFEPEEYPRIARLTPAGSTSYSRALWDEAQMTFVTVCNAAAIEQIQGYDPVFVGMLAALRWLRDRQGSGPALRKIS